MIPETRKIIRGIVLTCKISECFLNIAESIFCSGEEE